MLDLQEEFSFFFLPYSLSARVKPDQSSSGGRRPDPLCTLAPLNVPSARQAVDSLRLNAAKLPLRLSPQLQEVKGQLLAQTGQPPHGPPSVVALMAGRDRVAELRASDALRRRKNSPPSSSSSGVHKRDDRAPCDVSEVVHWEQTPDSLNNPIKTKGRCHYVSFLAPNCCETPVLTLHSFEDFQN